MEEGGREKNGPGAMFFCFVSPNASPPRPLPRPTHKQAGFRHPRLDGRPIAWRPVRHHHRAPGGREAGGIGGERERERRDEREGAWLRGKQRQRPLSSHTPACRPDGLLCTRLVEDDRLLSPHASRQARFGFAGQGRLDKDDDDGWRGRRHCASNNRERQRRAHYAGGRAWAVTAVDGTCARVCRRDRARSAPGPVWGVGAIRGYEKEGAGPST